MAPLFFQELDTPSNTYISYGYSDPIPYTSPIDGLATAEDNSPKEL